MAGLNSLPVSSSAEASIDERFESRRSGEGPATSTERDGAGTSRVGLWCPLGRTWRISKALQPVGLMRGVVEARKSELAKSRRTTPDPLARKAGQSACVVARTARRPTKSPSAAKNFFLLDSPS